MLDKTFIITAIFGIIGVILFAFCRSRRTESTAADQYLIKPGVKKPVIFKRKEQITHDTILLTFSFMDKNKVLGLDIGQHLRV